ncbi:MAG: chromate transporter [Vulcanimicrobiaceae bacterium]
MSLDTAWRIVKTFGMLSVLGFGGGKGIFPQMRDEVVHRYHWLTPTQFAQYYTIGKLVPGPTTIMSVLVGFSVARIPGAVLAALAIFVPSSVLMYVAVKLWERSEGSRVREAIGHGLAPAIVGLTWASAWVIAKGFVGSWQAVALLSAVTALSLRTKIPTVALILGAGLVGALVL